ncbi:MAG: hypothetical protein JXB07_15620 [Anaerolineae bacterium]|nr:hypothetical protein [Anaerolineae bacterium]
MSTDKLAQLPIIMVCLVLAGCASSVTATPTSTQPPRPPITEAAIVAPTEGLGPIATSLPTSTSPPTSDPSGGERPTRIPKPSDTPWPTSTPVPTATSYPTPAVSLSSTGPWLIFRADGYLWAMNQDGTGLTRLSNEPVFAFAVRPTSTVQNGLIVAYLTLSGGSWREDHNYSSYFDHYERSTLKLLSWPTGEVKTIVYQNGASSNISESFKNTGLVWSPSGNKLAFVGMVDNDDKGVNVFVYDTTTEEVTRIAANDFADKDNIMATDAYKLAWSADERYVIYQRYAWFAMNHYPHTSDAWSARADAGGITLLSDKAQYPHYPEEIKYLRWINPTEIILNTMGWGNNADEVRIVNIETGDYTTIDREPLWDVAYSPEHNTFLMTQWPSAPPNTLLIFYRNGERREVTGYGIKWVKWLSAYDVFLGQTPEGQSYLISPDGALTEIPAPDWRLKRSHPVIVSPDGQWWAWHHYHKTEANVDITASELWAGPAMAQPSVSLAFDSSEDRSTLDLTYSGNVIWSPDSQYLLWAARGGMWVARPPTFEAGLLAKIGATFQDAVWVH